MGIITTVALTGGAITSGVIAAGASFAASTAVAGVNIAQSGKQRKAMERAQDKSDLAMQKAQDSLDVNFMKGASIQKEPYELQREAGLTGVNQIVQAAQEGDPRGLAAAAGRAALANQQLQRDTRIGMSKELQALDVTARKEDARLAGLRAGLYSGESQLAAGKALYHDQQRQAANVGIAQGLAGMGTALTAGIAEYPATKQPTAPPTNLNINLDADTSIEGMLKTLNPMYGRAFGDPYPNPNSLDNLYNPSLPSYDFNVPGLTSRSLNRFDFMDYNYRNPNYQIQ